MKRKLRELFDDVFTALDELMYSELISQETFRDLDNFVKTPLCKIHNEVEKSNYNKNKKIQNFGKSSK